MSKIGYMVVPTDKLDRIERYHQYFIVSDRPKNISIEGLQYPQLIPYGDVDFPRLYAEDCPNLVALENQILNEDSGKRLGAVMLATELTVRAGISACWLQLSSQEQASNKDELEALLEYDRTGRADTEEIGAILKALYTQLVDAIANNNKRIIEDLGEFCLKHGYNIEVYDGASWQRGIFIDNVGSMCSVKIYKGLALEQSYVLQSQIRYPIDRRLWNGRQLHIYETYSFRKLTKMLVNQCRAQVDTIHVVEV